MFKRTTDRIVVVMRMQPDAYGVIKFHNRREDNGAENENGKTFSKNWVEERGMRISHEPRKWLGMG